MEKRNKLINFTKNISYTLSSNILSALVTVLVTLVVPKIISVEQYGYYQLYIFYIGYVGVSYLGWCDGMYLREGGKYYSEIDKPLHCTQFWLLGLFEVAVYGILFTCVTPYVNDAERHFVIICVCIVAIGMCLRWFVTFLLQATARIKEYAIVNISEKVLFALLSAVAVLSGYRGFKLLILLDMASKFFSLSIGVFYCRDMVFSRFLSIKNVLREIWKNISAGFKLMMSSLCGILIVGVVRFSVERRWDIASFSKVSLTLNVSNVLMTAINAIAVVIYPMLRRIGEKYMAKIYEVMRVVLMSTVLGGIIFYYPAQKLLTLWLPQYADSLKYAAILLPVCVYESKMSMLINTYYNTLRLETLLMKCNLVALTISIVCTIISTLVLNSITAAIFSILIVLIFRCVLCEIVLSAKLPIQVAKDIVLELIMTVAFIICNWYFGFAGMVAYAVCYIVYLIIKRQDIKETFNFIKSMG